MAKEKSLFLLTAQRHIIKDSGIMVWCMEKVNFNGLMDQSMMDNLSMGRRMATVLSLMLMVDIIRDIGLQVNRMELELYTKKLEKK